jgi:glucose-6-phosphate 1-dehydrogenase
MKRQDNDSRGYLVFGATGAWSHEEIFPSLYMLWSKNKLGADSRVLGVSRSPKSREDFQHSVRAAIAARYHKEGLELSERSLHAFLDRVYYYSGSCSDSATWSRQGGLADFISENIMPETGNLAYLFSLKPTLVSPTVAAIAQSGLKPLNYGRSAAKWHALVEKPWGQDLASCQKLFAELRTVFSGNCISPVNHYTGKVSVDNLRFMIGYDPSIQAWWNKDWVSSVTILADESENCDGRADTYDAMRGGVGSDMLTTHLIPLAVTCASDPLVFNAQLTPTESAISLEVDLIRSMKVEILTWGQYVASEDGSIKGYQDLEGVADQSITPTLVVAKVTFGVGPMAGVPFYLRTGKCLPEKRTLIDCALKPTRTNAGGDELHKTLLMYGKLGTKARRAHVVKQNVIRNTELDGQATVVTTHQDLIGLTGGELYLPYADILLQTLNGRSHTHPASIEATWEVCEPIFQEFEAAANEDVKLPPEQRRVLLPYPAGTRVDVEGFPQMH